MQFIAGSVEETPLAHACGRGDLEMAELLVAHGADINRLCAVSSSMLVMIFIMISVAATGYNPSCWVCYHLLAVCYG